MAATARPLRTRVPYGGVRLVALRRLWRVKPVLCIAFSPPWHSPPLALAPRLPARATVPALCNARVPFAAFTLPLGPSADGASNGGPQPHMIGTAPPRALVAMPARTTLICQGRRPPRPNRWSVAPRRRHGCGSLLSVPALTPIALPPRAASRRRRGAIPCCAATRVLQRPQRQVITLWIVALPGSLFSRPRLDPAARPEGPRHAVRRLQDRPPRRRPGALSRGVGGVLCRAGVLQDVCPGGCPRRRRRGPWLAARGSATPRNGHSGGARPRSRHKATYYGRRLISVGALLMTTMGTYSAVRRARVSS